MGNELPGGCQTFRDRLHVRQKYLKLEANLLPHNIGKIDHTYEQVPPPYQSVLQSSCDLCVSYSGNMGFGGLRGQSKNTYCAASRQDHCNKNKGDKINF